ncbi:hypothetical protein Tco_1032929 [Tanacetum coccineum]|uniref:Uncharacterized protein n=1 Tax=Tanacetum coccineum TaxID=301880 RepID=A0ABQ5GFN6_9ASTR
MPCGATTLTKHVVEVRHVVWMNKIQDVWRIGKILISKIWWWMFSSGGVLLWSRGVLLLMLTNKGWVDGNGSNLGGGFGKPGGGREKHLGRCRCIECPVANYPDTREFHRSFYYALSPARIVVTLDENSSDCGDESEECMQQLLNQNVAIDVVAATLQLRRMYATAPEPEGVNVGLNKRTLHVNVGLYKRT